MAINGGSIIDKLKDIQYSLFHRFRSMLPPSSRKIIESYGNEQIIKIIVNRIPVNRLFTILLALLSLGKAELVKKRLHYDNIFHLRMILILRNGKQLVFEKTHVPNLESINSYSGQSFPINSVPKISLNEFVMNTQKFMGNSFFTYNPSTNNCQRFVLDSLRANHVPISSSLYKFIWQDAQKLVSTLPTPIQHLVKKILD